MMEDEKMMEWAEMPLQEPGSGNEGAQDEKLEDMLAQVEYCIEQLENPQISLEDSFRYYEEGICRLKECSGKVEQIEQKMMVINRQGELEEFQPGAARGV